jgi:hypothetical protein
MLNNVMNISKKVFATSGSNRAIASYGRGDEHLYQRVLKGVELKRDIEVTLLADNAKATGSSGTRCGGVAFNGMVCRRVRKRLGLPLNRLVFARGFLRIGEKRGVFVVDAIDDILDVFFRTDL